MTAPIIIRRQCDAHLAIVSFLQGGHWHNMVSACEDIAIHLNLTGIRTVMGSRNWTTNGVYKFARAHNIDLKGYCR